MKLWIFGFVYIWQMHNIQCIAFQKKLKITESILISIHNWMVNVSWNESKVIKSFQFTYITVGSRRCIWWMCVIKCSIKVSLSFFYFLPFLASFFHHFFFWLVYIWFCASFFKWKLSFFFDNRIYFGYGFLLMCVSVFCCCCCYP